MDDAEDEFAYQTAVNIGGHVFKGILYDQGPEGSTTNSYVAGESSSTGGGVGGGGGAQPNLNLIAPNTTTTGALVSGAHLVDPSSMYPPPLNTFMAGTSGTQFFPHPRSWKGKNTIEAQRKKDYFLLFCSSLFFFLILWF